MEDSVNKETPKVRTLLDINTDYTNHCIQLGDYNIKMLLIQKECLKFEAEALEYKKNNPDPVSHLTLKPPKKLKLKVAK